MLVHFAAWRSAVPAEDVSRLAIQDIADSIERREADCLGATILEDRDVCRCDANCGGEVSDGHLPSGKHDIDIDDDRHLDHPDQLMAIGGRGAEQSTDHNHHRDGRYADHCADRKAEDGSGATILLDEDQM